MFTKKITDSDQFTTMPPSTQCLYFHLCMGADDEGFSNNIRIALFNSHATTDDFNTLVNKQFIIPFDSGVIVIRHWRLHNYIQSDRFHETKYLEEKQQILLQENGMYTECIQDGYKLDTQISEDKYSKDNNIYNGDLDAFFEKIWSLYPKKKGKGNVSKTQKKKLYDLGLEKISLCIERYVSYVSDKDPKFIMYGSSFFNSGYIDYLDENYSNDKSNDDNKNDFGRQG